MKPIDVNSWHYRLVYFTCGASYFYHDGWKEGVSIQIERIKEKRPDADVAITYRDHIGSRTVDGEEVERILKPEIPRNVSMCKYFWTVVFSLTLGWWFALIVNKLLNVSIPFPEVSKGTVNSIYSVVMITMFGWFAIYYIATATNLSIILIEAVLCIYFTASSVKPDLGVTPALWILQWIIAWRDRHRINVKVKSDTLDVVAEYLSARKNGYCPTLDFMDSKKEP